MNMIVRVISVKYGPGKSANGLHAGPPETPPGEQKSFDGVQALPQVADDILTRTVP